VVRVRVRVIGLIYFLYFYFLNIFFFGSGIVASHMPETLVSIDSA
jgi:hypothetical protein